MRARNLKPGFFKNDELAECDPLARILYEGLWCMADREGRMDFRSKKIKAEILPYDSCDVIKLLAELQQKGFIVVYKVDQREFLSIPTFLNHQNPHIKEAISTIPAPDENSTSIELAGRNPESLVLNPSSLNPSSSKSSAKHCLTGCNQNDFDSFWKVYPKKKSKGQAIKAFTRINPDEQLLATMIATIERAKNSADWLKEQGQYIPHPATWLNARGWEDEIPTGGNNGSTRATGSQSPRPGSKDYVYHDPP